MTVQWQRFTQFVRDEVVAAATDLTERYPGARPRRIAIYDFHARDLLILFPTISVSGREIVDVPVEEWEWHRDSTREADRWVALLTAYAGGGAAGWESVITGFYAAVAAGCREADEILASRGLVDDDFATVVIMGDGDMSGSVVPTVTSGETTALDEWFDALDQIGWMADDLAAHVVELVRDNSRPLVVRARAASTLAWVGRLDAVVAELSSLTDEHALDVAGRPYLGQHKNGRLCYAAIEQTLDAHPTLHDALVERLSPTTMYAVDAGDLPAAISGLSSRWLFVRRHAAIVLLSAHM